MMAGRDRKNSIKALFGDALPGTASPEAKAPEIKSEPAAEDEKLTAGNAPETPRPAPAQPPRAASGAIKAMGLTLSSITREAEEARTLRQAIEAGERVVELDPSLLDSSFVSDRLTEEERDDPDFLSLMESIRESGQHAPILARPHPERAGHYQVAYGHRRLKAARRLGLPVKAIVRPLSDNDLVLAQGKENAERRNLSFIERAIFARTLVARGFDRKLTGDALSVQKSELSRLLQVADAVPEMVVRAIGPAPKAGRDRWMALGQLFSNEAARVKALDEAGSDRFRAASSDERFQMILDRLSQRAPVAERPSSEALKSPEGKVFARIARGPKGVRIEFARDADPAFLEGLAERLSQDYARALKNSAD